MKFLKLSILIVGLCGFHAQVNGSEGFEFVEIPDEDHPQTKRTSQALVIYSPKKVVPYFATTILETTVSAGQLVLDNGYVRSMLAWSLNYCGLKTVEEVVSLTVCGIGTLAVGPVGGNSAYLASKTVINTARWIVPAFDLWFAGLFAPVTKLTIIAPVINYGPTSLKSAAKTSYGGISHVYKYFWS